MNNVLHFLCFENLLASISIIRGWFRPPWEVLLEFFSYTFDVRHIHLGKTETYF